MIRTFATIAAVLALTVGCSEYEVTSDNDLDLVPDTGAGSVDNPDRNPNDDVDTGTTDDPDITQSPFPWEPNAGELPPQFRDQACPGGTLATFDGGMIWVGSWSNTSDSGTLTAPAEGWFHAYSTLLAESGNSQWNESSVFRVKNTTWPAGTPYYRNCSDDWVVPDVDNYGAPSGSRLYIGTFWMDSGANTLQMDHYCPMYRAGQCPGHHIPTDPSSTCDSGNINSVHYEGLALCLVPVSR